MAYNQKEYHKEYYQENKDKIDNQKKLREKRNKSFPKWIDKDGKIHKLSFDPKLERAKFERFKANLKETL